MFGSDIQVYCPWDVCRNSSKSGFAFFVVVETIFFRKRIAKKKHMTLFEEIRVTSQNMFGSAIQVYFPWDVSRNSSKSGVLHFSKNRWQVSPCRWQVLGASVGGRQNLPPGGRFAADWWQEPATLSNSLRGHTFQTL